MRFCFKSGALSLLAAGSVMASVGAPEAIPSAVSAPAPAAAVGAPAKHTKNLARTNMGTMLTKYDATALHYVPIPESEAWMDEDSITAAILPAGRHYYLLTLQEPNLLQNFMFSGAAVDGTVSLYSSDQKLSPGNKFWKVMAKGLSAEALKDQGLPKPIFRYARYLLVETNLKSPAEVSSLFLFGDSDASAYKIKKRAKKTLPESIVGPYQARSKTQFNLASLYAQNLGKDKGAPDAPRSEDPNLLALMDDSPLSKAAVGKQPMQIDLQQNREVGRFSMSVKPQKGKLVFSMQKDAAPGAKPTARFWVPLGIRQVSWIEPSFGQTLLAQAFGDASVGRNGGVAPLTRSVEMNGSNGNVSFDLPNSGGRFISIEFDSSNSTPLEIESFGVFSENISVSDFEVGRAVSSSLSTSKPNEGTSSSESEEQRADDLAQSDSTAAGGGTTSRISFTADGDKINPAAGSNLPKVLPVSN